MKARLFAYLALVAILTSCESPPKPQQPPPQVTDFVVEPKTIPAIYEFVGFAESSHPVEIRARVEGYLDKIAYNEGSLVHEGDLLFQLDPRQYAAQVEQARAEVARQQAILENSILTVNRLRPLYEQKAASKKDLDNAIASQLASEASVLAAKAQLLQAEINLGYTTITSPITGMSDRAKWREGALINPGANSLMTTVSVLDPIWVYFSVADSDILKARLATQNKSLIMPKEENYDVEVIQGSDVPYPHKGKVDFSAPTYDQSTGTLLVRAVFPNPMGDLRPGQFVRVKVYGIEHPEALFVPQRALMQRKTGMYVYLIDKDNKVIAQDVSTGDWYGGDYQIITNGLKAGDRIVVDGINKVYPGMNVNVVGPWNPTKTKIPDADISS